MRINFKVILFYFLLGLLSLNAMFAHGQAFPTGGADGGPVEASFDLDVLKRANVEERMQALGNDLLGDQVDPNTGSLSFAHTDISLPGNSGLEVAIRRTRNFGDPYTQFNSDYTASNGKASLSFADWELEVPKVSIVSAIPYSLCDSSRPDSATAFLTSFVGPPGHVNETPTDANNHSAIPGVAHSNGVRVSVPGRSQGLLLDDPVSELVKNDAIKTSLDNWSFSCITTGQGGLIGTAPNGDEYKFDQSVTRPAKRINMQSFSSGAVSSYTFGYLERIEIIYQVSRVVDINGNWVDYDYDPDGWLIEIKSNDGRRIEVERDSKGFVDFIKANGRTWQYNYHNKANGGRLISVTRPDGLAWSFDLGKMTYDPPQYWGECNSGVRYSDTLKVTHPYGASGTFTFQNMKHFRAPSTHPDRLRYPEVPHCKYVHAEEDFGNAQGTAYNIIASITEKRLELPSNQTPFIWTYAYSEESLPEAQGQKWSDITDPSGTRTRFMYHVNDKIELDSLMDWSKTYNSSGDLISETDYDHVFEAPIGTTWLENENINRLTRPRRTTKTILKQNGDIFTSKSSYNTAQSSSGYSFGNPTETQSWSNYVISGESNKRITNTTYEHNKDKWILGLPKTVSRNGRQLTKTDYNTLGQPLKRYQYNQTTPIAEYTYHSDGTMASVTDAMGRKTEASDWHRGKPQRVELAVGTPLAQTIERELDDNGWIMSQTDAKDRKTTYQRDIMGRLTRITPHTPAAGQGYKMRDTIIDYTLGDITIQMITTGPKRDFVYYDSMLRPYLERSHDLITGKQVWTNTKYDALGRPIFRSQPSSVSDESNGVETEYDGLGRVTQTRENVAPYATTTHEYLSYHRKKVTDAEGHEVTTYQYGWDGPDSGVPYLIRQHGITDTWVRRNVHGEITRVDQNGTSGGFSVNQYQHFYYDSNRRLCRSRTPEGGDTLYQYNNANEMTAYAKGQGASSSCADPSGNAKVSMTYDDLGRLKNTLYTDPNTADISRDYDVNGNITQLYRGSGASAVNWDYLYDGNDMLKSEELTIAGAPHGFDIRYLYNAHGHMYRKYLPSGKGISYATDGLGRDTKVSWGSETYAQNASYHRSGALESLDFGNGTSFTQTLNARLQPYTLKVSNGSSLVQDMQYDYDKNGRVQYQTNHLNTDDTRYYQYDAVGRLKQANSATWGQAEYSYDALGNLRKKYFSGWNGAGPRTVTNNYNSRNRIVSSIDSSNISYGFGYDTRGNIRLTGLLNFTYDMSDQPVAMSGRAPNTGTQIDGTYLYDGNMKRVKSVVNGKTIYNVYDAAGRLVHVDEVGGGETDYLHGMGQTLARIKDGEFTYLHPDHLGSPQVGTNEAGAISFTESYTPFGEALINAAANDNQSGFTGHIKDKSTGLNYMQARYYDPNVGRFLSVDPVGFMDTGAPSMFNRYAYSANDPVNNIDPSGECVPGLCPTDIAMSAVAIKQDAGSFGVGVARGVGASIASTATLGQMTNPGGMIQVLSGNSASNQYAAAIGPASNVSMAIGDMQGENLGNAAQAAAPAGGMAKAGLGATAKVLSKIGSAGGPGAGKAFSTATQNAARAASGNKCVFCGTNTVRSPTPTPNRSNIDHAIPKSRGGNNTSGNAQNTCQSCNLSKGAKTTEEFLNR